MIVAKSAVMLKTMLMSTSPPMYSRIDSGEVKRLRKFWDHTSSRNDVVTPCKILLKKSQSRTAPKSIGMKFTPGAVERFRYRVINPHKTMFISTHAYIDSMRAGLPRSR
jgi:hypothetical protein